LFYWILRFQKDGYSRFGFMLIGGKTMRGISRIYTVVGLVLIINASPCFPTDANTQNEESKYLRAVREFADNVLKYGRDTYGPKHTPLFVDGLNIHTHEPVKWISLKGDLSETTETEEWILCNLASQQNLFRTLDGLTKITGDPKYRRAAMEAIEYAFANLRSPNGLLYWGIYTAYDAQADKVVPEDSVHILKANLPYYELMWQVNPEATKRLIESFWSVHIKDWLHLDMDRIGRYDDAGEEPWNHKYEEGPIYLESGGGIPFLNAGTDLLYAAAMLTKLSGDKEPLVWAKRLAYRYVRTRHPNTGISYYMYKKLSNPMRDSYDSVMRKIEGEETNSHFIDCFPWPPYINPLAREDKRGMFTPTPGMPTNTNVLLWQTQFLVGEMLGGEGSEFKEWALEELTAFGKASYRENDNVYMPILTDGTSIDGYLVKETGVVGLGPKGGILRPAPVWPSDLWAYAMGYRVTKDAFMWEMARNIAKGNKYGDIGVIPIDKPQLNDSMSFSNPYALLAFLELYMATGKSELLSMAKIIGDNILDSRFHKGFFAASNEHVYTKFDAIDSLALLHLHSALAGGVAEMPHAWPSLPYFTCPYRLGGYVNDNYLLYTRTDPSEPPLTLQEAAASGDIELARSLLDRGADLDYSDDGNKTALQFAAMNGHREMIELLLAEGARIDAQESYPGRTALDYAVEKGYKDIVELLITKGADVNVKIIGPQEGDTPLHTAIRMAHKDIVELLISKGADVNAKSNQGEAPIDIAMRKPHMDIASALIDNGAEASFFTKMRVNMARQAKTANLSLLFAAQNGEQEKVEALLDQGVDINLRDSEGNTSLYYAAREGHGEVAQLLIEKGADVTVKDAQGMTPLYFAVGNGMDAVAELIIAHDNIDVNVQTDRGWTPLHMAVVQGHKEIVQSLIDHGAEVNVKNRGGQTPIDFATRGGFVEIIEILTRAAAEQAKTKEKPSS
jgi:pectate lyase